MSTKGGEMKELIKELLPIFYVFGFFGGAYITFVIWTWIMRDKKSGKTNERK